MFLNIGLQLINNITTTTNILIICLFKKLWKITSK